MTLAIDIWSSPNEMREAGFVQETMSTRSFNGERIGLPIWHLDGVAWHEIEPPTRWHKHWVQTCGRVGNGYIERCPCGAIGQGDGVWIMLDPPRKPQPNTWWHRLIRTIKKVRFIPA